MVLKAFLLLFYSLLAWADPSPRDFSATLAALREAPELHYFTASDGTKLAYSVFAQSAQGGPKGPIAIPEGKGESVYRYLEFASEMQKKGWGPIYVLDQRGQGFSDRVIPEAIHVTSFDTYADDFIKFMDGPVKDDLLKRGIKLKPKIVAHSMGSTIAELALRERPDLAERIAHIAPMWRFKQWGPIMEATNNKPLKYLAATLTSLGFEKNTVGGSITSIPKTLISSDLGRIKASYNSEIDLGIRTPKASYAWVNAALDAGYRIQEPGIPEIPSLIFRGHYDQVVSGDEIYNYACRNELCTLVELPGAHALHQERELVRLTLEDQIDEFLQGNAIPDPAPGCENVYKVLVRARR